MNIISLFSGAGGLDLGFENEGFQPVVAYDVKPAAVKTYNYNRQPSVIAQEQDLSTYSGEDIIDDIAGLNLNEPIRGVIGGPPCQYFSYGNKSPRDLNDPRRTLPISYANILQVLNEHFKLDFFIFENVIGLARPAHKDDFQTLLTMFSAAGFHVRHEVLDAYDYGVPQHRKRVFLIGWNQSIYSDLDYKFPNSMPSGVTVRDAIGGVVEPTYYEKGLNQSEFPEHPNHWTMKPKSEKFRNPPPPDMKRATRSFRRLGWDRPSDTVAYGHNEIHVHPSGHRRLSVYEAMLLQGFPREYQLVGNFSEQVNLISDAVPPPLAGYLAQSIKQHLKTSSNGRV